jgi:ParB family chromosome partitioning protein
MDTRPVDSIKVGTRHRKVLGNVKELADSIAQFGLLHPIVITSHDDLIAGQRRLEAVKLLGWHNVPVRIINLDSILDGEAAENAQRKNLLPSEVGALARALLERETAKAQDRQRAGTAPSGKLPEGGEAREIVARQCGVSRRTLDKILTLLDAAEADHERFGDLVEKMDRAEKVHPCFMELERRSKVEQRTTGDVQEPEAVGAPDAEHSEERAQEESEEESEEQSPGEVRQGSQEVRSSEGSRKRKSAGHRTRHVLQPEVQQTVVGALKQAVGALATCSIRMETVDWDEESAEEVLTWAGEAKTSLDEIFGGIPTDRIPNYPQRDDDAPDHSAEEPKSEA